MFHNGECTGCIGDEENFVLEKSEDGEYVCKELCGKGRKISEKIQCDDGNLINGDGCSDTCGIEEDYWNCDINVFRKSICKDTRPITFDFA